MKIIAFLMMCTFATSQDKTETLSSQLEGVWELETYTRKGKTHHPKIKIHFTFSEGYFNEVCFSPKQKHSVNPRSYIVSGDRIHMFYDQDRLIKAEAYKIWQVDETQLKLETTGDDFLIDNWSATIFLLNKINPKS